MENAIDALKIVFGMFVFILALTLLFSTTSIARRVAADLVTDSDRTTYYTYIREDEMSRVIDDNGNRIVTIEDIIPALYRYYDESYGVTIINKSGEIVARFNRETEDLCTNWPNATENQKGRVINEINEYVIKPTIGSGKTLGRVNVNRIYNAEIGDYIEEYYPSADAINRLQALFEKLYKQNPTSNHKRTFSCPWGGTPGLIAQRVDSDLSRNHSIF